MQDVSAPQGDGADIVDRRFGDPVEPGHVRQRITLSAHAADFVVVVSSTSSPMLVAR
jgi:hypothetical protein